MARALSRFLARSEAARWRIAARYLAISAVLHLGWEIAHLPFYTLWLAPLKERVFAVLHCTGGDILIAVSTLALAVLLVGRHWPWTHAARRRVILVAIVLGVGLHHIQRMA